MMSCIILSQLILIGVFKFWPAIELDSPISSYEIQDQEIFLEQTIATRQENTPASPPKPQIPIPVPTDEVIEDELEFLDFESSLNLETIGEGEVGQTGNSDEIVGSPQRAPVPVRIIEPSTPESARAAGIKAEVFVTFLVNVDGNVEDFFISNIRQYDKNGDRFTNVESIGYNIMETTLKAAQKWQFRPGMNNGKPVKTYSVQVFSFGF